MRGIVHIIDRQNSIGKVLFDGNKESGIIEFPATFNDGDKIEIEFRNGDIEQQPVKMIAYSENNYGFVMQKFSNTQGIILVTYPEIIGLVTYHHSITSEDKNPRLIFTIKKTIDSKMQAINIHLADKKEHYKAQNPVFGKLVTKKVQPKEGFVSDIIKTTKRDNVVSGRVSHIRVDRKFGFIVANDGGKDIYFRLDAFKRFYSARPRIGDEIDCVYKEVSGGKRQVVDFCKPVQMLPLSQQFGIINGSKFRLQDYVNIYEKEPETGDIVYYTIENGKIVFKTDQSETEKIIFVQSNKHDTNMKKRGSHILYTKKDFGFIEGQSYDTNIYFRKQDFINAYKREPAKNDYVEFTVKQLPDGRLQVKAFIPKGDDTNEVFPKNFINFVYKEPNQLYYAYKDENSIKEVYRFDSTKLSQSISCYKDNHISKEFKLIAIDCLLENNYTDKYIDSHKLRSQKKGILNTIIDENIRKTHYEKALEAEYLLQKESYNPSRLNKLAQLRHPEFNTDIQLIGSIPYREHNEKYAFITDMLPIETIEDDNYFNIDLQKREIKEFKIKEACWLTKEQREAEIRQYRLDSERFEITIED